jgi:hypothetical protein
VEQADDGRTAGRQYPGGATPVFDYSRVKHIGGGGGGDGVQPSVSMSAVLNLQALVQGERAFLQNIPQTITVLNDAGTAASSLRESPPRNAGAKESPLQSRGAAAAAGTTAAAGLPLSVSGSTPGALMAAAAMRAQQQQQQQQQQQEPPRRRSPAPAGAAAASAPALDHDGSRKIYGATSKVSNSSTMRMKTLQKLKRQA